MPARAKSLIFCVHAHQPVGNFENVFAEAYEKCYRPFFEVLNDHPGFPIACHLPGSLLDWLEGSRPRFMQLLKNLSDRGQVEFIGGGYYEPIYGVIPRKDLVGQIRMMREKLKSLFGEYPAGAWLTERVWDPDLVVPLCQAEVEYTILDDFHFERAGVPMPITGYYQARQGRQTLDLFASIKHLRYLMPFRKAEDTLDYIHSLNVGSDSALVFADDCEKFGLWPGTYGWVYQQKWLNQLLTLLENDAKISVCTFSQFRQRYRPKKAVKIPHGSYSEMMEWSGGRFYNFFDRYPESRYMRDRMWQVSAALQELETKKNGGGLDRARQTLYRAQCNCPYWHGVFGGLYLHHLRSAVFENLIKTEHILSEVSPRLSMNGGSKSARSRSAISGGRTGIQRIRLDSGERWLVRQKQIHSFFNPRYGAALEELDYIPMSVNLMCNVQRHHEPYHALIASNGSNGASQEGPLSIHQILGSKEKGLEKRLFYDPVRRLSFLDHFFEQPLALEDFHRSSYREIGDFVDAAYKVSPETGGACQALCFKRSGHLRIHQAKHPLRVVKTVAPRGDAALGVRYEIRNTGPESLDFTFGVEFNFSIGEMSALKGLDRRGVRQWVLNDAWRGVEIRLGMGTEMDLLATPVETVSGSESGLGRTYQELAVLLQKKTHLRAGEAKETVLELEVR